MSALPPISSPDVAVPPEHLKSTLESIARRVQTRLPPTPAAPDWSAEPALPPPTHTNVPNVILDRYLAFLSGSEVKVLLYVCRRTFGFGKASDPISLNQMFRGIQKRDGTWLDHGVGLSRSTLLAALTSLEAKRLIVRRRRSSQAKGHEATSFALRVADHP